MTIEDTSGIEDTLSGIQKNEDGSITIESGQGGVDIEVEPTRAPLTAEEWEALLARADARNGNYTPTFYRDPATGSVIEVQVVYMGIGRSMIMVNGQEKLVNTVELHWETEAPEDKVLAVINAPDEAQYQDYHGEDRAVPDGSGGPGYQYQQELDLYRP